jgi:hypothetical protein
MVYFTFRLLMKARAPHFTAVGQYHHASLPHGDIDAPSLMIASDFSEDMARYLAI